MFKRKLSILHHKAQKAPKIFYSFLLPLSCYYYYYLYSLSSRAHGMKDPLTHRKLLGHNWTVVAILHCPWASYLPVWIILCRWCAWAFGAANRLHNKMQRNIFSRVDAWCENLRIYLKFYMDAFENYVSFILVFFFSKFSQSVFLSTHLLIVLDLYLN